MSDQALDRMSSADLLALMNAADAAVPAAVASALPDICQAVEAIISRLRVGGRLIYVGAGTSGRLAALDAAECPPTFGIAADTVQAVLAGGSAAMLHAAEGAEDDAAAGAAAMDSLAVSAADAVVGIAASATTPFTVAALREARRRGAFAVAVGCRPAGALYGEADLAIVVDVGPEVIGGSTRLKAGTAQKLVLNMISTAVMIRLGHVYGNLMVDVRVSNEKLRQRAIDIVASIAGLAGAEATAVLAAAGDNPKTAIVMARLGTDRATAEAALAAADGDLRRVIG